MARPQGSDPGAAPRRPLSFRGGAARISSTCSALSTPSLGVLACALLGTAGLLSGACTGHRKPATPAGAGEVIQRGEASWYGAKFNGRRTASGERFNMRLLTAAHPTLPFGTLVRVTNVENGRQVVVRINDRGPFKRRRVIDVSYAAARELELLGTGTARVELALMGEEPRPEPVQPLIPAGVVVADLADLPAGPPAGLPGNPPDGPAAESPSGLAPGSPAAPASDSTARLAAGSAAGQLGIAGARAAARPGAAAGELSFVPVAGSEETIPSGTIDTLAADPGPPPEPVFARADRADRAAAVQAAAPAPGPAASATAPGASPLAPAGIPSAPRAARAAAPARPPFMPRTARPVGGLHYTVQVGAFGDAERAESVRQQLAARYPQAAVRSDGIWSRVQVGHFANRDDAEALRRELADAGLEALVTTAP
jgi:rare lipoprotein A